MTCTCPAPTDWSESCPLHGTRERFRLLERRVEIGIERIAGISAHLKILSDRLAEVESNQAEMVRLLLNYGVELTINAGKLTVVTAGPTRTASTARDRPGSPSHTTSTSTATGTPQPKRRPRSLAPRRGKRV